MGVETQVKPRKWDTGLVRPYRPKPADFRERYIEMGWDGIDEHYQTNWRVIRRWIDEEGREELSAARTEHVRAKQKAEHSRRHRYVMGRTLTPRKKRVTAVQPATTEE